MPDAMSAYYDRQYNARAMIPDHAMIFERWKTRSQEARAGRQPSQEELPLPSAQAGLRALPRRVRWPR